MVAGQEMEVPRVARHEVSTMLIKFSKNLQLSDIPKVPVNIATQRHAYRIAIIDNELFTYCDELRRHGFDITELGDIRDFAAVAEYPIVACDIKDVGKHFGTSYEGAHVIGEIRKRYPGKYLIAYSSGVFGPTYKTYWDSCDICLRRDGGFDQWVESLDKAIVSTGDPVHHWKRIRAALLNSDISALDIYLLENAYIRSILKKDSFHLDKAIQKVKKSTSAGKALDTIAGGLISAIKLFIHIAG